MPKVALESADGLDVRVVDAPPYRRLLDVCDEIRAPIPFSCRSATCATCECVVLEGAALLEAAGDDERALLERLGAPASHRLACQVVLHDASGLVRLRAVRPVS